MQLGIQHLLEAFVEQSPALTAIAVICAVVLVFLLAGLWLVVAALHYRSLSIATLLRIALLMGGAYLVAHLLSQVVMDPRPYVVDHTRPLTAVSADNGFPSDHVLLAAALTISLWWIDRRWIAAFAAGTVLVMFGRMAVGAHHFEDVLGSVAICVVVGLVVRWIPLPSAWRWPIWSTARPLAAARGPRRTRS